MNPERWLAKEDLTVNEWLSAITDPILEAINLLSEDVEYRTTDDNLDVTFKIHEKASGLIACKFGTLHRLVMFYYPMNYNINHAVHLEPHVSFFEILDPSDGDSIRNTITQLIKRSLMEKRLSGDIR